MGWFLTGSKSKRRSKSKASSLAPNWNPQRTLMGLRVLGIAVAIALLVFGWQHLENYLSGYVAKRPSQQAAVNPDHIHIAYAPQWMSPVLLDAMRRQASAHLSPDPMDHVSLENARQELSKSPWLEGVRHVQRVANGQIVVYADFRVPMAVVESTDGYHLIDSKGVRLTGPYRAQDLTRLGLPVITGVSHRPGQAGDTWPGADIQAGLALVRLVADQPFMREIKAFDVSGRDSRGRIQLAIHTAATRHRWGLPPGEESPIEPEARVKLRSLASLFAQRKTIDLPGRTVDLRISSDAVFVVPAGVGDAGTSNDYTW